jgi:hypothetical protein
MIPWFGQEIVRLLKVWMGAKAQRMQFAEEACPALKMTTVLAPDPRIGIFLWMKEVLQLLALPGLFKRTETQRAQSFSFLRFFWKSATGKGPGSFSMRASPKETFSLPTPLAPASFSLNQATTRTFLICLAKSLTKGALSLRESMLQGCFHLF